MTLPIGTYLKLAILSTLQRYFTIVEKVLILLNGNDSLYGKPQLTKIKYGSPIHSSKPLPLLLVKTKTR